MTRAIEPQSQLKLLQYTKLSNDYLNQIDFETQQEQESFFLSKVGLSFDNYRYIRKGQVLQLSVNVSLLDTCDYVMYKNKDFGENWIYAFITRTEYISDNASAVYIEMDCFQTFLFRIQYFPSFISRSHEQDFSSPGVPNFNNTYPEQLEYGRDYEIVHSQLITSGRFYAIICSSASFEGEFGDQNDPNLNTALGGVYDKLPSALDYYVIDNINGNENPRTSSVLDVLSYLSSYPWISRCIQSVTVVPQEVIGENWQVITVGTVKIGKLRDGYVSSNKTAASFGNWLTLFPEFKNGKLYSFPYSYLEMTCYNGTQFIIRPECVNADTLDIKVINYVGAQPRLAYYVEYYNQRGDNGLQFPDGTEAFGEFLDASIVNGNFPQLPVTIDNYMLYMASNANSMQLTNTIARYNQMEGVVGGVAKLLTGNIGGGIQTAYSGIKQGEITMRQQAAKIQDAQLNPPSLAGQSGGDAFNIANDINGIVLRWKTIRPEYRERLEKYFMRYGFAQNKIAYPNFKGMSIFNYIQTTDITLGGSIPADYLNVIKRMFDNGVTMWHNHDIGNYNNNNIWVG